MLFFINASQPATKANLETSFSNPYDISKIRTEVSKEELKVISQNGRLDKVSIWGVKAGTNNIPRWGKVKKGDSVIVYENEMYTLLGNIFYKMINENLANKIWGKQDVAYQYLFFVEEVKGINITKENFNDFFNYDLNFFPRGFGNVNDEKFRSFFEKYDNPYEFINGISNFKINGVKANVKETNTYSLENLINEMSDEEFIKYLDTFDFNASYDTKNALVKIRKYNRKIIKELKERYNHCCQICGEEKVKSHGVSIVEAHHILPFSISENNHPNNIMILCPNHHNLIHKAQGEINVQSKKVTYINGFEETIKLNTHLS